ncbi:MBL fold metallo-hydrolase, partial [candidate division KSB1 bacterium]
MKKNILLLSVILIVGAMLISCLPAFAQTEEDKLINSYWLTDRILIVGYGEMQMDMVAAVNTEKGIVIIDSGMSPSLSAKYRLIIEKEFGRSDFKYVINTHHDDDHINGNQVFTEAEIIAHQNAAKRMIEDAEEAGIKAYVQRTRKR